MEPEFLITDYPDYPTFNKSVNSAFFHILESEPVKKTHLFNNRYENIYIPASKIPEINQLSDFAQDYLKNHTDKLDKEGLKTGFWFNLMQPGDQTTLHTHDDAWEVYSAVYYLHVPENSGDLVLHLHGKKESITPKEGQFVFFSPDLAHEVTKNNSKDYRLSVAFNFGY